MKPVVITLVISLFWFCTPRDEGGTLTPVVETNETVITLNSSSMVTAPCSVQAATGEVLTIDSGTKIIMRNSDGNYTQIPESSKVKLTLAFSNEAYSSLPSGAAIVTSFSINAAVDGKEADLKFISNVNSPFKEMPVTGAHIKVNIPGNLVPDGTRANLYKVSESGEPSSIGSVMMSTPLVVLSKVSTNNKSKNDAWLSPDGTGEYDFYYYSDYWMSEPGEMPSSGVYWSSYSKMPDTAYTIGDVLFDGPYFVGYIKLIEYSTTEILADLRFQMGVNCVTYIYPNDKSQFWAERTQDVDGRTTSLKIASTSGNLFFIIIDMHSVKSGRCYFTSYFTGPDNGVVHSPDGNSYSDPYSDPEIKIAGFKTFKFKVDGYWQGKKIQGIMESDGYETSSFRLADNISWFDVSCTTDGRARIEKDVLAKNNWYLAPGGANRSVGLYEFCDSLVVNVTSHSNNQTVPTKSVTVSGTFKNPKQESDPLTKLLISCSNIGTATKQVEATISDSTFSAQIDLEPGKNMLTFLPTHQDSDGRKVLFPKYIIKAKDTKIDGLVLNYEPALIGKLDFERITTSTTTSPDTSVRVSTVHITADLILNFKASKLSYILQSHANAVSCAENDNCYLFSGKNSGLVTIAIAEELKSRGCDGNLPLVVTETLNGESALSDYSLTIEASLSPWATGDTSTSRKYHLTVNGSPSYKINTSSDWPVANGKLYNCNDKEWKPHTRKIGPMVTADDRDILQFIDSDDLEEFAAAPEAGHKWSMHFTVFSEDSLTTIEYKAELLIE